MTIRLDYNNAFIKKSELENLSNIIKKNHNLIHEKKELEMII